MANSESRWVGKVASLEGEVEAVSVVFQRICECPKSPSLDKLMVLFVAVTLWCGYCVPQETNQGCRWGLPLPWCWSWWFWRWQFSRQVCCHYNITGVIHLLVIMLLAKLGSLSEWLYAIDAIFFLWRGIWLAIRFKITTGYTRVFLRRILAYIRYVWALSPYIRPFRLRIYAFFNGYVFAETQGRVYAK